MKRYQRGEVITDFNEFLKQEFIYHRHKVLHRGWFLSWTLHYAVSQLKHGNVFCAIKTEKEAKNVNEGKLLYP